ncbi:MAG: 23S rRNA (adenine(2503)-C(2))-methyltransferase RlmN [Armatimonadota bacterium]|nr:MAG: 23S rRNA (adenine(2503)-C(2))-methyltransferase RlmN [Armatimonadota bacterium]
MPDELEQALADAGHKPYRARQILRWMYRRGVHDVAGMTDLPQQLRDKLSRRMRVHPLRQLAQRQARDGSAKLSFRLPDRAAIETVIMPHGARATVCVSSQVGCAYNCAFCATGALGLERDLTPPEIVGQILCAQAVTQASVTNVVFMGMGEPLANYEATLKAVRIINHRACLDISARRIAISTCGLPEQMRRLAGEGLALHLAVSLNAPYDKLRTTLMPVNRRYPVRDVVAAAREYAIRTGRKVAFEYCLLDGVNDSRALAAATAKLLRGMPCMVNLIPCNEARAGFRRPPDATVRAFRQTLEAQGMEVAVRRPFGEEIAAACGQLAGPSQRRRRQSGPRGRAGSPRRRAHP